MILYILYFFLMAYGRSLSTLESFCEDEIFLYHLPHTHTHNPSSYLQATYHITTVSHTLPLSTGNMQLNSKVDWSSLTLQHTLHIILYIEWNTLPRFSRLEASKRVRSKLTEDYTHSPSCNFVTHIIYFYK